MPPSPSPPPPSSSSSSSCPFCAIASALPPSHATSTTSTTTNINTHRPSGGSAYYALLSTPGLIAILDIAPVTRGHTLLIPRRHCETVAQLSVDEGAAAGVWLGVLSRAVVKGVSGGGAGCGEERAAWNLVQANGASAGQTVPHVHFHIIPRGSGDGEAVGESAMTDAERKNLVLGEGPRVMISKEEGEEVSRLIREEIAREVDGLVRKGEMERGDGQGELWVGVREGRLKL